MIHLNKNTFILSVGLAFMSFNANAQADKECIKEVIGISKLTDKFNDTVLVNKCMKVSYSVRVTNHDDETVLSNVKMYSSGAKMDFYSEQAIIHQSENEALLILPQQKLVILNSMTKEMTEMKLSDTFYEIRNSLLDNSDVLQCNTDGKGNKRLKLKINSSSDDIHMTTAVYEYSLEAKKIKSITINYDGEYKLKQMHTVYNDIEIISDHNFVQPRSYALDKKGNLLSKYAGWEFMDNREVVSSAKN